MDVVSKTAKSRLSATVDTDVLAAVQAAVAAGEAESVSAYVNDALRLKAEHDRRLRALTTSSRPTKPSTERSLTSRWGPLTGGRRRARSSSAAARWSTARAQGWRDADFGRWGVHGCRVRRR